VVISVELVEKTTVQFSVSAIERRAPKPSDVITDPQTRLNWW
jgi:hypothetical protein